MKKKLIITSSLITILLALFPVSLYAEEVIQDPAPANTSAQGVLLDSYFYDNYDILPYLVCNNSNQYIDTGIKASSDLRINTKFSLPNTNSISNFYLFGIMETDKNLSGLIIYTQNQLTFNYRNYNSFINIPLIRYNIYNCVFDKNNFSINDISNNVTYNSFLSDYNIYIFKINSSGTPTGSGLYNLYSFSIYDYSLDQNNQEIGYVRYFYPAKAKTSGTIGLYDAVSKTFFPSIGSAPFDNPTDDKVLNFQITDFITAGLSWIGDILDFAIETPIILFFLAVGLAGAMYRWARRLVHF